MTASQAAKLIGCHPMHVRLLIRQGKLPHTVRKPRPGNSPPWEYDVDRRDALRIKRNKSKRGRPRGSIKSKEQK